jgi:hypothetical protein
MNRQRFDRQHMDRQQLDRQRLDRQRLEMQRLEIQRQERQKLDMQLLEKQRLEIERQERQRLERQELNRRALHKQYRDNPSRLPLGTEKNFECHTTRSGITAYTLMNNKDKNSAEPRDLSPRPIEVFSGTSKLINNSFSTHQIFLTRNESLMSISNNEHAKALDRRLLGLFESKAIEFTRFSEENPQTAGITMLIAGLYKDLATIIKS